MFTCHLQMSMLFVLVSPSSACPLQKKYTSSSFMTLPFSTPKFNTPPINIKLTFKQHHLDLEVVTDMPHDV